MPHHARSFPYGTGIPQNKKTYPHMPCLDASRATLNDPSSVLERYDFDCYSKSFTDPTRSSCSSISKSETHPILARNKPRKSIFHAEHRDSRPVGRDAAVLVGGRDVCRVRHQPGGSVICTRRAGKLNRARSQLYRSQILQENMRWN